MKDVVFVTGNQNKADYLAKLLSMPIDHEKADVDEIQSMDLREVAEYKARQAFELLRRPVLVEDQGMYLKALNGFPGPFIKFLVEGGKRLDIMCTMLDGFEDRTAVARTVFAYYDGTEMTFFESELKGEITTAPRGNNGWGWDSVFCPDGYGGRTRAELSEAEDHETYLRIKPINAVKEFLEQKYEANQ